MKYTLVMLICLTFTSIALGAVASSSDAENHCTLFQAVSADDNGRVILKPGQTLLSSRNVYGLSFLDMEIDFDRKEVLVQPMMNIILGFDQILTAEKAIIRDSNPDFKFLINQLNRKIVLFEKICINPKNEVVYAKLFETPEQN